MIGFMKKFLNGFRKPTVVLTLTHEQFNQFSEIYKSSGTQSEDIENVIIQEAWNNPRNSQSSMHYRPPLSGSSIPVEICEHVYLVAKFYREGISFNYQYTIKFYCKDCGGTFDYIELLGIFIERSMKWRYD